MDTRLTRRDAVAALGAAGVAVGAGAVTLSLGDGPDGDAAGEAISEDAVATLVAAAHVLYPTDVENVGEFVTRYVRGRADGNPDHAAGTADAAAYLDEYAEAWHGERFGALDRSTRERVLGRMGADTADPDPAGSDVERVRYYVVNELLFALYATPTGAELVGLENPPGHPGGLASYQRGPSP